MARIVSVNLDVGRSTSRIEFAELNIVVEWTSREVQENYQYLLRGMLIEKDDGLDFYDMNPDGSIHWRGVGNLDDYVGVVGTRWIRPNNSSRRTIRLRREWDFGNQERGSEEYIGVATIVPETRGDLAFSQQVNANLG